MISIANDNGTTSRPLFVSTTMSADREKRRSQGPERAAKPEPYQQPTLLRANVRELRIEVETERKEAKSEIHPSTTEKSCLF